MGLTTLSYSKLPKKLALCAERERERAREKSPMESDTDERAKMMNKLLEDVNEYEPPFLELKEMHKDELEEKELPNQLRRKVPKENIKLIIERVTIFTRVSAIPRTMIGHLKSTILAAGTFVSTVSLRYTNGTLARAPKRDSNVRKIAKMIPGDKRKLWYCVRFCFSVVIDAKIYKAYFHLKYGGWGTSIFLSAVTTYPICKPHGGKSHAWPLQLCQE